MGASDTGDDLSVGERNESQNATELVGRVDENGNYSPNYIFWGHGELLLRSDVHGVVGFAHRGGIGVWGKTAWGDGTFGETGGDNTSGAVGKNYGKGFGVFGYSAAGTGAYGASGAKDGVYGYTNSDTFSGTVGRNDGQGAGVFGYSQYGSGVFGISDVGDGVFGQARLLDQSGVVGKHVGAGYGVFGYSLAGTGAYGASDGGDGVFGYSRSKNYSGTVGRNDGGGFGVYGFSAGFGVHGSSIGGIGVEAQSDTGYALAAEVGNKGVAAGFFLGDVYVVGDLRVTGAKSAAVPHPDGSHRLLYCMESPECWFEDFGVARLIDGRAKVKLASDFAATIKTGDYHIFLTPYGDSNGLYVAATSATGFTVREQKGGRATLRFSYRIVARRKDIASRRMPKVKVRKPARSTPPKSVRERGRIAPPKAVPQPKLSDPQKQPRSPSSPRRARK